MRRQSAVFLVFVLVGAGAIVGTTLNHRSIDTEQNAIKGTALSHEEAAQVAKEQYHQLVIEQVDLRHLSHDELQQVPTDAKDKTPVYYVVRGRDQSGSEHTVFVSSNNRDHHFQAPIE